MAKNSAIEIVSKFNANTHEVVVADDRDQCDQNGKNEKNGKKIEFTKINLHFAFGESDQCAPHHKGKLLISRYFWWVCDCACG